jgi:PST family polysaccharide transporter
MVTMTAQGASIVIQLASTIVLARLLSPEDFGIIAMVTAVTAFAAVFRDLGLSSAAIQSKTLSESQQSNLFWVNAAVGAFLTAVVAAISPLIALFYGKPELTLVSMALSTSFLIVSLGTQHDARLIREMQFGRRSASVIGGAVMGLAISIALALAGYSYWALAWGNISGAATTTLLLFGMSSFKPGMPKRGSGILQMVKFGANVTGFNVINYFARNLDKILLGRVWGSDVLGYYSKAYALLMFPLTAVRRPVSTVAFPAMSKLQNDPAGFRAYYRRVTLLISLVTMPIVAYSFICARPLIDVLLGPKWLDVVPIFSVLAATAFIQAPVSLNGLVQLSLGRSRRYLMIGATAAVAVSIGFCIGVRWGPIGVAAGYAAATYLFLIPLLWWGFRESSLRVADFFESIALPAITSLAAAAVAWGGVQALPAVSVFLLLLLTGALFAGAYLSFLLLTRTGRTELHWFYSNVRSALQRSVAG